MIPLAQFLTQEAGGGDEFVPFRKVAARRQNPAPSADRTAARNPAAPVRSAPAAMQRPVTEVPAKTVPAAAALRPVTEPRSAHKEFEAERAAWTAERESLRVQMEAAVAEARQSGIAEGEDKVRQDLERVSAERLEELRRTLAEDSDGALAEARKRWVEEEGDRLADLLVLQMAVFEDALRATLNALLRPLVLDARKRMTVDELAGAVKAIAFDGTTVKIAASGPGDLLGALETRLGDDARHVSFDADDSHTDVRIDANQTVIETRLASWLQAVEEALS